MLHTMVASNTLNEDYIVETARMLFNLVNEIWDNTGIQIEQIDLLLQGALRAESFVCLKMNAPAARLDAILGLLPALNSPTVASLKDPAWFSLETVVDTHAVRDLIPRLHELGAEGILEYSLNKVI